MTAPETTYWEIVKTQFNKHRTAVWGLRIVSVLFFLAIGAPILATSSPFAFKRADGEWSYPWFRDLLDQNVFPTGVDLFFNLMLIFLVPAILLWVVTRWTRGARKPLFAGLGALFLWCFVSMVVAEGAVESGVGRWAFLPHRVFRYSHKKVNWLKERRAVLEEQLCRERVEIYEGKIKDTAAILENLERELGAEDLDASARINLEAEREAQKEDLSKWERQLKNWRSRQEAVTTFASEPANQVTAIMPPIGYHHDDNDAERITEAPTFSGWGVGHFLGTDSNGRDVLARLLYGIRVSLTVGVIAVSIYCTIGAILGAIMGYFGGWVDMTLMRFVEIMICFPTLPFILIIVAVFRSKSIFLIVIGIAVVGWTGAARLIRGQFLQERSNDYVTAAQALGIPTRKIVFRHVLPNAIHPLFVTATFGVAAAILVEAGLAFLGLGDPNVPSWGQILLEGRQTMKNWLIFAPGIAIFLTVTVLNLVGEGLRDALDPKLRQ